MIKAVLIDDESHALDALQDVISQFDQIQVVGRFTNPIEALHKVKELHYHAVFLDIEMPGIKGLEAAETLMEIQPETEIVFITAYDQYAVEAFELNALDYLSK